MTPARDPEVVRETCESLLKLDDRLSDWERAFVASVMGVALARVRPSERQALKLEAIARRVGVARGLTIDEEDLWR